MSGGDESMRTRIPKYRYHVTTAIDAAKLSIEMFNRVTLEHSQQAALIFNAQAWELLSKGILIREKKNIYNPNGTTITAEQAVNRLQYVLNLLSPEENQTIQQVISLRNEAMHGILPVLDPEIAVHLMYFSLRTFHRILKEKFRSYFPSFDKNYLSIAFRDHTFYSHKVSKLLAKSRKFGTADNRILYLLDRAVDFAMRPSSSKPIEYKRWKGSIQNMPRKARVSRHLKIYRYINAQDDVRFVPIHVARGYRPEIQVARTRNPLAPVLITKTDPNVDYPLFTKDIAEKLGRNISFVARTARKLGMITSSEYCTRIKLTRKDAAGLPKYNQKALDFMRSYLEQHPDFSPYK